MSAALPIPPAGVERRCSTCFHWAGHDGADQRGAFTCRVPTPPLPDSVEIRPKLTRATEGWACPLWAVHPKQGGGSALTQAHTALKLMLQAFGANTGGHAGAHARIMAKQALRAGGVDLDAEGLR